MENKNDKHSLYNPKGHRPDVSGGPAWLKALVIVNWVDGLWPSKITFVDRKCSNCDADKKHKKQDFTGGKSFTCIDCGKRDVIRENGSCW